MRRAFRDGERRAVAREASLVRDGPQRAVGSDPPWGSNARSGGEPAVERAAHTTGLMTKQQAGSNDLPAVAPEREFSLGASERPPLASCFSKSNRQRTIHGEAAGGKHP